MLEELELANKYIYSKINEKNQLLLNLESYAKEFDVPIVTKEVAEYLSFLIKTHGYKDILEVGTAIGYSGIVMLLATQMGSLTTIEIDEERYKVAEENFLLSGMKDRVDMHLGDATDVISTLKKEYDFIFIDASKGQYQKFFLDSLPLLKDGGLIFIDNIMFRGYLYNEYPKRFKTIVNKLDKFIDYLYENHNFVLLPFGDGIGLVYKDKK